jgi:hypothetical protein
MPDSPSPQTEQGVQPLFRKSRVFSYLELLCVFFAVVLFDQWVNSVEVRSDGPVRQAAVHYKPLHLDPGTFSPLRLAGAWEVQVDDPRFGGVSALTSDGDNLLAVTDSGSIIRLPRPGRGTHALVKDLPAGPGLPQFKVNRDAESLVRDPAGRGWWVAFEFWHQLWLYDAAFGRALERIDLGEDRWRANGGLEAIAADSRGLLLFPQTGKEWLRLDGRHLQQHPLDSPFGDLADAARLPDGRLLLVTRKFALTGLDKHLVLAVKGGGKLSLRPITRIALGARDNVEGLAVQPLGRRGTRLWLITDNDFRPRKATLLIALDLP